MTDPHTHRHQLRHWATDEPDRLAVRIGDETLTYAQLEAQANQLAHVFQALGLVRGDHIAVFLPNTTFVFVVAWAAYRCGLYTTPASTYLSAQDASYIVGNSRARLVIADPAVKAPVSGLPVQCPRGIHWLSHGDPAACMSGYRPVRELMATMPATPCEVEQAGSLMMYTSGTTGSPKGVWRPLPAADYTGAPTFAADLIKLFSLDEHIRYLSTAPLYHAAPLRFALAVTATGGTVFAMPRFDAEAALGLLASERITHSQWVPTMLQRLLRLPDDVRSRFSAPDHAVAIHAAAPCPVPVKRAMIDWWGPILVEYYSGSEGVGLTIIDSHEWLQRPGSVGRSYKGVPHVLDDNWAELPPGTAGRIYFSGVAPFEYFGEPEKTALRTSPQGYQTLGDIGYVDDAGYMFLCDRMDDMMISGGVNIYPQEVEAALMDFAGVLDAGVVGDADEEFGERPAAFVVRDPACVAAPGASPVDGFEDALKRHCITRLGPVKAPRRYVFLDAMPRSPTGKLLRKDLRTLLGDAARTALK